MGRAADTLHWHLGTSHPRARDRALPAVQQGDKRILRSHFPIKEGQGWEWAGSNSKLVFQSAGVEGVFQRSLYSSQQAGQVQPPRASRESWLLFQFSSSTIVFIINNLLRNSPFLRLFCLAVFGEKGLGMTPVFGLRANLFSPAAF